MSIDAENVLSPDYLLENSGYDRILTIGDHQWTLSIPQTRFIKALLESKKILTREELVELSDANEKIGGSFYNIVNRLTEARLINCYRKLNSRAIGYAAKIHDTAKLDRRRYTKITQQTCLDQSVKGKKIAYNFLGVAHKENDPDPSLIDVPYIGYQHDSKEFNRIKRTFDEGMRDEFRQATFVKNGRSTPGRWVWVGKDCPAP